MMHEERHEQRLHLLLRLLAPTPAAARRLTQETLADAAARPHLLPAEPDRAWSWLAGLAVDRLRRRPASSESGSPSRFNLRPDVSALRQALNAIGPSNAPFGEGPTDATLLVLVRALPAASRCALALATLYGLPAAAAARFLELDAARFRQLHSDALNSIHRTLHEYAQRQLRGAVLASKHAPRLRPLPVAANGTTVIRGTRVYVDPNAPTSLVGALLRLLARLQERVRHSLHLPDPGDDDVGETHNHQPLDPTPTTQPIRKPPPTPSLEPHRMPKPTGGTAVHRRSPQGTPSTQRLSARPRPLSSGARTSYSWRSR
jgi:DNA-directed RNA polymerase specialized sigma24 family protein